MPESIDDLYARWQRNPDVAQTVAMCDALRATERDDLVEIVGYHASRQLDVHALKAAARMYTDTGRLDDAQQVLIAAGRLAPRDGAIYQMLGEVLLRRGDADRAEKVLDRAVQLGGSEGRARVWLERARSLRPTQASSGMLAVAEEVSRAPSSDAVGRPHDFLETMRSAGSDRPRQAPPAEPDEAATTVFANDEIKTALTAGNARAPAPPPAAGRTALGLGGPLDNPFDAPSFQTANVTLPLHGMRSAAADPFATRPRTERVSAPAIPLPPPPPPRRASVPAPLAPAWALEPPVNPALVRPRSARPMGPNGQLMPEARDVLEALQISGVFEPDGAVRPQAFAWDKPAKGKRRIGSYASLIGLAVLIVLGATGSYYYVGDTRAKQHIESETLLAQIDQNLRLSDAKLLDATEQGIAKCFDLESRSPHAALTWLHERAMVGLLKGGENVAFEDATVRAKEVGVDEKRLAFTYVASFLFQGDTAGAAGALAKWDGKADDDPWYQLIAGATFERAGDPRALERYAAAVKLDPDLLVGTLLLLRATAVDGDPHHAGELAKQFRAKYPERIEGATMVALAWARDPLRGDSPPEAKEIADKVEVLPTPLKAVAPAVRALLAIEQHKTEDAKLALQKGLSVADTPGIAAWLGSIALTTGDEALARRGALSAVSYSAGYAPARMLAARVALLGARLDEALKATEDLAPGSPDVAIVNAAVAYEKLDSERMRAALDGLADGTKRLPFLVPLVRGQALLGSNAQALGGDKALDMADDDVPWADLVSMDFALDTGDVDLAHKIAAKWTGEPKALRATRLATVARWDGRNDDADRFSRAALQGGTVTVRALAERAFVLVAMNKATEAIALFKAYPNVGGPLAKWLRAYAVAASGKVDEARAVLSQEDPPPPLAPLPSRIVAAVAYGAVKDTRRGGDYVRALAAAGFANPDVIVAAEKVGAGKITRRR